MIFKILESLGLLELGMDGEYLLPVDRFNHETENIQTKDTNNFYHSLRIVKIPQWLFALIIIYTILSFVLLALFAVKFGIVCRHLGRDLNDYRNQNADTLKKVQQLRRNLDDLYLTVLFEQVAKTLLLRFYSSNSEWKLCFLQTPIGLDNKSKSKSYLITDSEPWSYHFLHLAV